MKRKTSSWFTPILTVFLLLAPMSGSTLGANAAEKQPATSSADTIKLAIFAPLSLTMGTIGVSGRNGALLAIEQQNARGGILGMTIDPVIEATLWNYPSACL